MKSVVRKFLDRASPQMKRMQRLLRVFKRVEKQQSRRLARVHKENDGNTIAEYVS